MLWIVYISSSYMTVDSLFMALWTPGPKSDLVWPWFKVQAELKTRENSGMLFELS